VQIKQRTGELPGESLDEEAIETLVSHGVRRANVLVLGRI